MSNGGHWIVVREVISATNSGAQVMSGLPGMVRRLLDEDAWREFPAPGGRLIRHSTFAEFLIAPPPHGLGGKQSQLLALCGADKRLAGRVRRLLAEEVPASRQNGANQHTSGGDRTTIPTRANTAAGVLARLKRDDPDMAALVIAGEITSYAASREKGWKPPRINVSSPERVAASLRRNMPPGELARLAALLTDTTGDTQP